MKITKPGATDCSALGSKQADGERDDHVYAVYYYVCNAVL